MKSFHSTLISALFIAFPTQAQTESRNRVEMLVAEATQFAKQSGAEQLIHEINYAKGRFANRDASKPQLVVYDLKGKTLAHAGDVHHVGMDHSHHVAKLLEVAKTQERGWLESVPETARIKQAIYFEKISGVLITVTLQKH